jgi:hypothetical protein
MAVRKQNILVCSRKRLIDAVLRLENCILCVQKNSSLHSQLVLNVYGFYAFR